MVRYYFLLGEVHIFKFICMLVIGPMCELFVVSLCQKKSKNQSGQYSCLAGICTCVV
jgi:hypothetical protein